jgi:hypothetical protein
VLFGLFCFGIAYTLAVNYINSRLDMDGHVAYEVAFGVFISIVGIALIDSMGNWPAAAIATACFVADGIPMLAGDILTAKVKEYQSRSSRLDRVDTKAAAGIQAAAEGIDDGNDEKALA